jgi:PAS domain S-box-containing protein
MLAAYAPVEPSGWGVIVQQPLAAANAPAIDLRHFFLTVVLVSAGIAAFLGVFIAHRIAVPLSRLESSAATIATGNLEEPVPALGHDEIGRLAVTFDEMRLSLKESRRQLEKANENFRVLLDATPAAVLLLDPEGIVMAANEIAATRLGKTLSEIMGTDIFSHLPPDLAETRKARLEEMKRSGRPIHFEDIDNNCHLDNYVHPIFTPAGDLACLAVLSVDITDRKRAEAVLATTKAQLEKTFAVMGEMVLLVDPATRTITACNPAVQDIFGYCPEEVVGRNTEFLHVDRAAYEEFGRRLFQALDQDGRAAFEFQMKRQDGSLIPCEHSVTEILDEAGRRTHMVGIIRDISERQQAEAALRQSEAHLREAQRIAHIGSWSMNLADNIIRWSDEMYRLYGVTKEEFPHTVDSLLQLLHPDDRPLLQRWIEQAIANLKPLELDFRIIRPDGTIRYIRGSGDLFTDPAGQPERIAGTAQDITERKRAEENIRQRTAELTALNALAHRVGTGLSLEEVTAAALDHPLYPSQPDLAMFYLREDDRLVFQKARPDLAALSEQEAQLRMGECLCGLALEEGKAVYSSNIHVDPRCTLPACKEAGMRSFAALPLLSGERILGVLGLAWVEAQDPKARAEFLETSAGEIAMGLHNALLYQQLQQHADQLDCRVRERTVQVQAANKELEAFAYSISHDLRAPLRAISGFAQIIARRHRAALNEEGQRYFDNIVLAAERMSHLIDDLLAFSRLGRKALTPRPVDLGEILEQVCRELADRVAAAGASLQVAQDLPAIPGDPTLLGQAFTNLLDNALTYRRPGVAPEIRVSWSMEDGRIVLAVADNGIGIAPEYQEKIFNVFQRLHSDEDYPGTGIGLAIVKKAAEMLGGQVWVESMVDQGSTFYVKLPKE